MRRGYEVYSIGVGTSPTNRINYENGHMFFALHTEGTLNGKSPS